MDTRSMAPRGSWRLVAASATAVLSVFATTPRAEDASLSVMEALGKEVFFDTRLSEPSGMACASCHAPAVGYSGPSSIVNLISGPYPGAIATRFGNRKPPSAAYAGDSPSLSSSAPFVGGMFWDGRATGEELGDPLAEQALGPFLNPLEHNLSGPDVVVARVLASSYGDLFTRVCGGASGVTERYACIGRAIAAYERSVEVSSFSSKYDLWLAGRVHLTALEEKGRRLFEGDRAKCAACHPGPLFTDFTYDNLGVPRNVTNPFYREPEWNPQGRAWIDPGLGGALESAGYEPVVYEAEWGKMKVPTLRNVDKRPHRGFVKAYGHNGYFRSLEAIVHFYNTRDVLGPCRDEIFTLPGIDCWPSPEVPENVNREELGNLGLTPSEERAIVAFLRTLSDGYRPRGN